MSSLRPELLLLIVPLAPAQHMTQHKGHPGAEYKMTQMSAPPLRTGLGGTTLTMTTKSAQAQRYFVQGVELLHCFWDFEAYRAFKEAARLDPNAAMAWWGIVQSIDDYDAMGDEKKAALEKAKALLPKASAHEQYYLRAQQKEHDDDHDGAVHEMEMLIDNYPEDVDAKLFLAISSKYGYDKKGDLLAGALYPLALVENVLAGHPDNAAANHYLIHILEGGPHADRALHAADVLGKLAPASGHMVHMPGHIYYKLGDQGRARQAFLDSMKVDEEYMQREHVGTLDDWNYAHNLSYLIASDAEAGRYREALDFAAKLDRLPANPFLAVGRPTQAITIGSTTTRLQLRFGNWQAVIDHPVLLGDPATAGPPAVAFRDGVVAYARGMLALENKQLPEAARQADALDALQWRLNADREDSDDDDDDKPDRVLKLLETASLDLRGNLACAQGNTEKGFQLLQLARSKEEQVGYSEPPQYGRPESESAAYAYLQAGQFDRAREAFQSELKLRPKSGHALYGIALSYEKAGKQAEARRAYDEFLLAWKDADPDLPMMQHARSAQKP
jgi:tetratricopeptide (TPR) repeat protein